MQFTLDDFELLFSPETLSFTDAYNKKMEDKYDDINKNLINTRVSIVALMTNYIGTISKVHKN